MAESGQRVQGAGTGKVHQARGGKAIFPAAGPSFPVSLACLPPIKIERMGATGKVEVTKEREKPERENLGGDNR